MNFDQWSNNNCWYAVFLYMAIFNESLGHKSLGIFQFCLCTPRSTSHRLVSRVSLSSRQGSASIRHWGLPSTDTWRCTAPARRSCLLNPSRRDRDCCCPPTGYWTRQSRWSHPRPVGSPSSHRPPFCPPNFDSPSRCAPSTGDPRACPACPGTRATRFSPSLESAKIYIRSINQTKCNYYSY